MPKPKTQDEMIKVELLRFQRRLAKMNSNNLVITNITITNTGNALTCDPGYRPEMVRQEDGSFKLECVRIA